MRHPDNLTDDAQIKLEQFLASCPHLEATAAHVTSFAEVLTEHLGAQLNSRMSTVSADDLPHLHRFVRGLDTDHAGVRNALTLPYSSGTVYCLLITAAKKHIVDEHDPSWLPGSNDEIAETPRILNTMRGLGEYLTIAAERRTGRSR